MLKLVEQQSIDLSGSWKESRWENPRGPYDKLKDYLQLRLECTKNGIWRTTSKVKDKAVASLGQNLYFMFLSGTDFSCAHF